MIDIDFAGAFKFVAVIGLIVGLVAGFTVMYVVDTSLNDEAQIQLLEIAINDPDEKLRVLIRGAIMDGVISEGEYAAIMSAYQKRQKE